MTGSGRQDGTVLHTRRKSREGRLFRPSPHLREKGSPSPLVVSEEVRGNFRSGQTSLPLEVSHPEPPRVSSIRSWPKGQCRDGKVTTERSGEGEERQLGGVSRITRHYFLRSSTKPSVPKDRSWDRDTSIRTPDFINRTEKEYLCQGTGRTETQRIVYFPCQIVEVSDQRFKHTAWNQISNHPGPRGETSRHVSFTTGTGGPSPRTSSWQGPGVLLLTVHDWLK